jgi:hypothetical protein
MAGRVVVSTLNDDTGVLATQNGMGGIAKAWVNFNGSTAAIRGSFNVTSISKNGTGDYTVNFTTAMPDANYCITQSNQWNQSGSMAGALGVAGVEIARRTDALTTTSARFWATYPSDQVFYDRTMVCIAIFR